MSGRVVAPGGKPWDPRNPKGNYELPARSLAFASSLAVFFIEFISYKVRSNINSNSNSSKSNINSNSSEVKSSEVKLSQVKSSQVKSSECQVKSSEVK